MEDFLKCCKFKTVRDLLYEISSQIDDELMDLQEDVRDGMEAEEICERLMKIREMIY